MNEITLEMMKEKEAFHSELVKFVNLFGESMRLTEDNWRRAFLNDIDTFFLSRFLKHELEVEEPEYKLYIDVFSKKWIDYLAIHNKALLTALKEQES